MTKAQLTELARVGMIAKLTNDEAALADAFKLFPDLFVSKTPPVLLRPELRNGKSAKRWPVIKHERAARRAGHLKRVLQQRSGSEALLKAIEAGASTAAQLEAKLKGTGVHIRGLGSLVRRGYIKKTAKGYARTSKAYIVDPREAGAR